MKAAANSGYRPWVILLAWGLTAVGAWGQPRGQKEVEVKTGLIFRIIEYAEWPAASSNLPPVIQIGLLGQIPYVEALELLNGKTLLGRKLVTKRISQSEASACQVLFIGASEKARISEILAALDKQPVLTMSELDEFPQTGVMVNLIREGNNPKLEINTSAAKRVGLKFGSQLLNRSRVYSPD